MKARDVALSFAALWFIFYFLSFRPLPRRQATQFAPMVMVSLRAIYRTLDEEYSL